MLSSRMAAVYDSTRGEVATGLQYSPLNWFARETCRARLPTHTHTYTHARIMTFILYVYMYTYKCDRRVC